MKTKDTNTTKEKDLEYLRTSADKVMQEMEENPEIDIPVDPEVAEF